MPTKLRKQIRNIVFIGLGVFVLVNGCSWQPGYGGRSDRKPGMEVERYFGWPACFYADLWQSDEATEVEPWNYAPPLPITSDMHYIYCSFGVVPLLLDIAIIVAAMGIAVVIYRWHYRGKASVATIVLALVLGLVVATIVMFGDEVSVYL